MDGYDDDDYSYPLGETDKGGNIIYTKREAKRFMFLIGSDPDFWISQVLYNKQYLQAALDVLYNVEPGVKFTANLQTNQYNQRINIYCEVCKSSSTSLDPFISHQQGKNHKKNVQNFLNRLEQDQKSKYEPKMIPLNSSKGIFSDGSLEDKIDSFSSRPVLGVHFLYKEIVNRTPETFYYSCTLCKYMQVSDSKMFKHLTGDSNFLHNRRYLEKKFNYYHKSEERLMEIMKEVERTEGKINHNITDFTKQNEAIRGIENCEQIRPPPQKVPQEMSSPSISLAETHSQCDADELDQDLSIDAEALLAIENNAEGVLANSLDSVTHLFATLQVLNKKAFEIYKMKSNTLPERTYLFQKHLLDTYKCIAENKDLFPPEN